MAVIEQERPVEAPAVTEADILRRAADVLEEFGWCRGSIAETADGYPVGVADPRAARFCVMGALARAGHDLGLDYPQCWSRGTSAVADAHWWLNDFLGARAVHWNDDITRTKEDVVSLLRRMATAG
jgi:hypothetical protein